MTVYPTGYVSPDSPIHPEAGVYILKNDELQITARHAIGLSDGKHILKIGTTGDFDTRRKTVNGEDKLYRAEPYFGIADWYLARFRAFGTPEQAAVHEREVHRQLNDYRLTMEQARALSAAHRLEIWDKQTRPEIFLLSLANPLLLKLIPSDPTRAKRPRDFSARFKSYIKNDF